MLINLSIAQALLLLLGTTLKTLADSSTTELPINRIITDLSGRKLEVTRVGNGTVGVIFFGHTGWDSIIPTIVDGASEFDGLLPEKASFFLWDYPHVGPFKENSRALDKYDEGDAEKFRPDFKGIATNFVAQIRQQTGVKQFLLVGNSLGAGVILWDYPELVKVHITQAQMVARHRSLHCQFVRRHHPCPYCHSMGIFNANSHRSLRPKAAQNNKLPI